MNEGGWLERVIRPLPPQLASCNAPQFRVNQRDESIERRLIATAPLGQDLGDRRRTITFWRLDHGSLESNSAEEILISWIGVYGVVHVVDREVDHVIRPLAIGGFQPGKCGVVLAEFDIQAGNHTG